MKKSVGHDNIPVTFIKLVVRIIAPFLIKVINASFELGMFPNILKIAKVIPIYKFGDKQIVHIVLYLCYPRSLKYTKN